MLHGCIQYDGLVIVLADDAGESGEDGCILGINPRRGAEII